MAFQSLIPTLAIILILVFLAKPIYGQINAPCTSSMLTTFNPCLNFLTSGSNMSSPTSDCCNSIKSLMANGTGCLCQIATGSIPFQIPINRSLVVSLPGACNMPGGVTLQCKGPVAGGPTMAPKFPPSPTPQASVVPESPTSSAPSTDSTPASSEAPTANSERRPSQNTPASSSSAFSCSFSPLLLLLIAINFY